MNPKTNNSNSEQRKIMRKVLFKRSSKRLASLRSSAKKSEDNPDEIKDNENEANDESSSDDEYVEVTTKRRRSVPEMWSFDPNEDIVQPEDVTEEMLNNVYVPGGP